MNSVRFQRTLIKTNSVRTSSFRIFWPSRLGLIRLAKFFGPIVGAYDMRVGDAHPTSSKIRDALKLAGIDEESSFMRQGQQLISNFGESIWWIGKLLFEELGDKKTK